MVEAEFVIYSSYLHPNPYDVDLYVCIINAGFALSRFAWIGLLAWYAQFRYRFITYAHTH